MILLLANQSLQNEIVPWLVIAAGLVGVAWINKRGQTGDAIDFLQKANSVLHTENLELKKERAKMVAQIAALSAKTDFDAVITPLRAQLAGHERRADERHLRTLRVLDLIAKRLGPDDDTELEELAKE